MRPSQCLQLKLCHCTQGNWKFVREREKVKGKKSLPFHDHAHLWVMKSGSCCILSPSPMTLALLFAVTCARKGALSTVWLPFPPPPSPSTLLSAAGGALTWERSIWNQAWLGMDYHILDAPAQCCLCISHVLWEYQPDWVLQETCHSSVSGCELHIFFSVTCVPRPHIVVKLTLAAVLEISRSPQKHFKI